MASRNILGAICCGLLVLSLGCSKDTRLKVYPVEGTVTLGGQPLANALVVLHPVTPKNETHKPSSAQTDASGKFKVTTYVANDGVPDGEYTVTVASYEMIAEGSGFVPGGNILAPELASAATSNIKVQVAAAPANVLNPIDVRRGDVQPVSTYTPAPSFSE